MIMKSVCDVRLPIVCVVRCLCVMGYQGHPTAYVVTQSKCFILHQTAVTQRTDLAWGASQTADLQESFMQTTFRWICGMWGSSRQSTYPLFCV